MATELTDSSPDEVTVIGVVPATTATGTSLSSALREAVEPVTALVVDELTRLGLPPRWRQHPRTPHIWWEE